MNDRPGRWLDPPRQVGRVWVVTFVPSRGGPPDAGTDHPIWLGRLRNEVCARLVIDLTSVADMDSVGLAQLVQLLDSGADIVAAGLQRRLRDLLDMLGLMSLQFRIAATVDQALRMLG